MSDVLVQGLKRRIEGLNEELADKKKVESKCRVLEEKVRTLEQSMGPQGNTLGCVVCMEETDDVTPCNHRLCKKCLCSTTPTNSKLTTKQKCPLCNTTFVTDRWGVKTIAVGGVDGGKINLHVLRQDVPTFRKYWQDFAKWAALCDRAQMKDPWAFGSRSAPASPVSWERRIECVRRPPIIYDSE